MRKTKSECLGPVGRRAILLISNAAKIVTLENSETSRIIIIQPVGLGWSNVWLLPIPLA